MNLIVGATGRLGSEICSRLADAGKPIRALVRSTASPEKLTRLHELGAELAFGDLKDPLSLAAACTGIDTVISTASATTARQDGDSIETVDGQGQLDLIAAAAAAGVRRFVFISFPDTPIEYPLQSAKRAAETRLRESGITFTILQPTFFTEVWLGPALGVDTVNATARIYGSGENRISWISYRDVARFAVSAVEAAAADNRTIKLGGPDALSPLAAVRLAEQIAGKTYAVQQVPEDVVRAQYEAATDSLQRSFAGLMLYYARGDVIDTTEARVILGLEPEHSVGAFFSASTAVTAL